MKGARSEEETVSLLRETLAGRAAVVTRAAEIPDIPEVDVARRRIPRWVPPLAAAAAAAAVAGTVVAIQHSTGHPTPPANSSIVTQPAPTHTSSPTPTGGRFCRTRLPLAWRQALTTPLNLRSNKDIRGAGVLARGSLIVKLGQATTTELALVTPDGSVTDLRSVPTQSGESLGFEIDGDQAALMVRGRQSVTRLYVYDDRTQRQTRIPLPASGTVDGATVMDGTVYWAERASSAANTGRVIAYQMASGSTQVAWQGTIPRYPWLQNSAGGVYLGTAGLRPTVLIAARHLPTVVGAHMTSLIRNNLLTSDGTSYAWLTSPAARVLYLWSPGMSAPRRLSFGAGAPKLVGAGSADFTIDGHWLYTLRGNLLLDLDTDAMARLPDNVSFDYLDGGYLVGSYAPIPKRITDRYRSYITRLPLAGLPDLHC